MIQEAGVADATSAFHIVRQIEKMAKVTRFHRNLQMNIGLIVGVILVIYVLFHLFSCVTKKHVAIYQVNSGTISTSKHYEALALRSESLVQAEADGQIYHFKANEAQVGSDSIVYSLDQSGEIQQLFTQAQLNTSALNETEQRQIVNSLSDYVRTKDDNRFYKVYDFKNQLEANLYDSLQQTVFETYKSQINEAKQRNTFHTYQAPSPGLLVYATDGDEGLNLDNFTRESFDTSKLDYKDLKNVSSVKAGDPVYKLISSEQWKMLVEVDDEMASQITSSSNVQLVFDKDQRSAWAAASVIEKYGRKYLVLSLDDSMERYADLRFVGVTLNLDRASGLKIPLSAITKQSFYKIPKSYFFKGGNSNDLGLLRKKGNGSEFIVPTIFAEDEEDYFINADQLKESDILIKQNSSESWQVNSKSEELTGVYQVNKGFAEFKPIEVQFQNKEFAVVSSTTSYGLVLYDRIALNSSQVKEGDMVQ